MIYPLAWQKLRRRLYSRSHAKTRVSGLLRALRSSVPENRHFPTPRVRHWSLASGDQQGLIASPRAVARSKRIRAAAAAARQRHQLERISQERHVPGCPKAVQRVSQVGIY